MTQVDVLIIGAGLPLAAGRASVVTDAIERFTILRTGLASRYVTRLLALARAAPD